MKSVMSVVGMVILLVILAGLVWFVIIPATTTQDHRPLRECAKDLKEIGNMIERHKAQNGGYPAGTGRVFLENLRNAAGRSEETDRTFICAEHRKCTEHFFCRQNRQRTIVKPPAITYRGPAAPLVGKVPDGQVIVADSPQDHGWGDSINALFADGHVETLIKGSPAYEKALAETAE